MFRSNTRSAFLLSLFAALLLGAAAAEATMVRKMDLGELCNRSDLIYRGRVLDIDVGSRSVGGAEVPTVTYTIDVSETLAGDAAAFVDKGDKRIARVTMVASKGPAKVEGSVVRFSKLPEMPDLRVGEEYLLITTRPGASGLSTTVGLGQGVFRIAADSGMAANQLQNAGLSPSINGPVSYSQLADAIRTLLAKRGGN